MTGNITSWFGNSTKQDLKPLKRVVKAAERIVGKPLKTLIDIDASRCAAKTKRILKDPSHPGHKLFCKLSTQRKKKPLYRSGLALTGCGRTLTGFINIFKRGVRKLAPVFCLFRPNRTRCPAAKILNAKPGVTYLPISFVPRGA